MFQVDRIFLIYSAESLFYADFFITLKALNNMSVMLI